MAIAENSDIQQHQSLQGGEAEHHVEENKRNIVFFDVETNVPGRLYRSYELLEFGAVVLDARGLGELRSYHTLVRPNDLSCVDRRTTDCNTITSEAVADAPSFGDVADAIYKLLHGQIWAGHNIEKFDIPRVNEAFTRVGRQTPQPYGIIDTYPLLRKTFGKRAGNHKLATLANYCGYGKQEHRSLADVRMNIDVLRSCATILFLELNYPTMFISQNKLSACTLTSEVSATYSASSTSNTLPYADNAEQEVDSQGRLANPVMEPSLNMLPSPSNRSSFVMSGSAQLPEVEASVKKPRLHNVLKEARRGGFMELEKESHIVVDDLLSGANCSVDNVENVCPRPVIVSNVAEDEHCESFQHIIEAKVAEMKHAHENMSTGFAHVSEEIHVADVQDAKLGEDEGEVSVLASENLEKAESELVEVLQCLTVKNDRGGSCTDKVSIETNGHESDLRSKKKTEAPFLLAIDVCLPSIQVHERPSSLGCSKVLYYEGFPLQLLEQKIRVRFTVNLAYAFDEKGRPRFSILVEPSEAACNLFRHCEDVVKSRWTYDKDVEWVPLLRKEFGCWTARMSIGTKWGQPFSTYTTEFFRSTSNGVEKASLGHVDASTFRAVMPHGSVIDVGFGFSVYHVNNRVGVKPVAKHITLI